MKLKSVHAGVHVYAGVWVGLFVLGVHAKGPAWDSE